MICLRKDPSQTVRKFNRWFISILEFASEFKHIPGKWNTIADGLSRSQEDNEKMITTQSFCFSCQVVDLYLEMVRREQEKGEDLQQIVQALLRNQNSRPDCELISGILYKNAHTVAECSRLYIPPTLIPETLKLIHSSWLAGHPGIKKSLRIATHNYF